MAKKLNNVFANAVKNRNISNYENENGLKKHVRNVARIKHRFVELVVIL